MSDRVDVAQVTRPAWPIPDWLSPARLITLTDPQAYAVTLVPGVVTEILRPNARRVGLVVMVPDTIKAGFYLSPLRNPDTAGISLAGSGNYFLATLSDWLSLTCGAWYGYHAGGGVVQVIDIVRPI